MVIQITIIIQHSRKFSKELGSCTLVVTLSLFECEGQHSRVIRNANHVANSGKTRTSSGKKPGFGDLDGNQDYFPYDEYSNEVKDPDTEIPEVTRPPKPEPPNTGPPTAAGNNKTPIVRITATPSNNTVGLTVNNINILTLLTSMAIIFTRNFYYAV